jgi:hypothetical protein
MALDSVRVMQNGGLKFRSPSAMDFLEHQQEARRRTVWMVLMFCAAAAVIVAIFNLIGAGIYIDMADIPLLPPSGALAKVPRSAYWVTTLLVPGAMAWGTLSRLHELSGGGASVAAMFGAQRIKRNSHESAERRLAPARRDRRTGFDRRMRAPWQRSQQAARGSIRDTPRRSPTCASRPRPWNSVNSR